MMMAVFDQYWLLPTAFTTDATHDGPEPSLIPGWSDACPRGMTQLTLASWPFAISVNTCVFGMITLLVQSAPVQAVPFGGGAFGTQMCSILVGAFQIIPGNGE
jgi:hypothetical protein